MDVRKRMIFEFFEGCLDGLRLRSDSKDPVEGSRVTVYKFQTRGGKLGRRFHVLCDAELDAVEMRGGEFALKHPISLRHHYRIVDRDEDETEVRLRCQYDD